MALKTVVEDILTIPENLRDEYEPKDGRFHLKLEGDIPAVLESNAKLAEFRDNNIALMKKSDELEKSLKAYEGIDPAEHKKLQGRVEELEKHGVSKNDAAIEARINAAVLPLEEKLATMADEKQAAEDKLARSNIEADLTKVALKAGVEEKAMTDYLTRGLSVFNLEGKAMKGDTPMYSPKNPTEGLSMEEWTASLMKDAPHLFKQSKGGGTPPGGKGGSDARVIGSDPLEFGRNLEGIAKGDVVVNQEF